MKTIYTLYNYITSHNVKDILNLWSKLKRKVLLYKLRNLKKLGPEFLYHESPTLIDITERD